MSTVITAGNATTGLSLSADNAGAFEFKTGTGAGTTAMTIDSSQNVSIPKGVGGTPAFSATRASSNQSITSATYTKVQYNSEEFDTNNNFDSTTNYRFTPTVAGYYQINVSSSITTSVAANFYGYIYKNGSQFKTLNQSPTGSGATSAVLVGSTLIYCNGSTDYIETYVYITQTASVVADSTSTYMQGFLARGA